MGNKGTGLRKNTFLRSFLFVSQLFSKVVSFWWLITFLFLIIILLRLVQM